MLQMEDFLKFLTRVGKGTFFILRGGVRKKIAYFKSCRSTLGKTLRDPSQA
jgi:hypothetical protein